VEREGFPVANLVAKMEAGALDAAPIFTDAKTFPYGKFRGCVDILSGGFPCQPFSSAGVRQGVEDPRHLFPYIADGIRECQPRIVFLENVEGIISAKTGDGESVLQYVLKELEGMGYRSTAGIFSASEIGAPHQRKRVFILGVRHELGDTSSKRCEQNTALRSEQQASWTNEVSGESHQELADPNNGGGNQDRQPTELRTGGIEQSPIHRWPARPGEAQQEWEEPRVVVNPSSKGLEGTTGPSLQTSDEGLTDTDGNGGQYDREEREVTAVADTKSQQGASGNHGSESGATSEPKESEPRGGHRGSLRESNGQAEPELGRTSNGTTRGVDATTNRVDRLRLLGNGVVNQTAAKAFVTLIQRVTNK
jgi:DNA (cytosine-5)-methyltransferase 1